MKSAFIMVSLAILFQQYLSAQGTKVLIDSIKIDGRPIEQLGLEYSQSQIDDAYTEVDAKGYLYTLNRDKKVAMALIDQHLESIQANLTEHIVTMVISPDGSLYTYTWHGLFKRVEDVWIKISDYNDFVGEIMFGLDGKLYGKKDDYVVKLGRKGWEIVGKEKMKILFGKSYNFHLSTGANGYLYVYGYAEDRFSYWDGNDWKEVAGFPSVPRAMCSDGSKNVYISTFSFCSNKRGRKLILVFPMMELYFS